MWPDVLREFYIEGEASCGLLGLLTLNPWVPSVPAGSDIREGVSWAYPKAYPEMSSHFSQLPVTLAGLSKAGVCLESWLCPPLPRHGHPMGLPWGRILSRLPELLQR